MRNRAAPKARSRRRVTSAPAVDSAAAGVQPSGSRTWRRLRMREARTTLADELRSLADVLRRVATPAPEIREEAAATIEWLADNKRALAAFRGRGRSASDLGRDVALDFCVQREIIGGRSVKKVRGVVAAAWGLKDATVTDYWTDYGTWARGRLRELIAINEPFRPRHEILKAISADLREFHARNK